MSALDDAVALMDRLWGFGGWETEQTHHSLRRYLIEETYELLDVLDSDDDAAMREELGDLLLQVLFHARIAEAQRRFTIEDVAKTLIDKLTHRSPHLTAGHTGPLDVAEQDRNWHARKATEKARASCLDGIPLDQPALLLTQQILARARTAGMPEDLVPDALRTVHIDEGHNAELELRAAALAFAETIRARESTWTPAW